MKFGKVENPDIVDFTLPKNHSETLKILGSKTKENIPKISIGCAKWNRQDLKGFYPRGTKDILSYYATQFNAIELNATFYGTPSVEQIIKWRNKTPKNFTFFPKITNTISHYRRLMNVEKEVTQYLNSIIHFEEKLGMIFLQMHENFQPKNLDKLIRFVETWPREIPLSIELRNENWFNDTIEFDEFSHLFQEHNITNTLVDTAGRRDMLHMRLTTKKVFIRYVAVNTDLDFLRLDDWIERLTDWKNKGLEEINFFIHQSADAVSPFLARYFIGKLNEKWNVNLHKPLITHQPTLF